MGVKNIDICLKYGISEQTFYNWKSKYGGMGISNAMHLKVLEDENRKLKGLVADLSLDNKILEDLIESFNASSGMNVSTNIGF